MIDKEAAVRVWEQVDGMDSGVWVSWDPDDDTSDPAYEVVVTCPKLRVDDLKVFLGVAEDFGCELVVETPRVTFR